MGAGDASFNRRPRVVLALTGELDEAGASAALKRLLALELAGGAQLVLDLSAVTFLDSTGVRLILQADERARRHGAGLIVVRGPEQVMDVLELVGLGDQLDIVAAV